MHDGRSDGRTGIKRCYAGLGERRRIAEREGQALLRSFRAEQRNAVRLFRVHRDRATRISVS